MLFLKGFRFATLWALLAILVFPVAAWSGDNDDRALIDSVMEDLSAERYDVVVERLKDFPPESKYVAVSAFIAGSALNRLGRYGEAGAVLEGAELLGYPGALLQLELGTALLRTGNADVAANRLLRFIEAEPEHAAGHELLGQALISVGAYSTAITALNRAKTLDPSRQDTVNPLLARIAFAAGDIGAVENLLNSVVQNTPDSPVAEILRDQFAAEVATTARDFKWWSISAGLGNDDNIIGLGSNEPLPSDITDESSTIFQLGANAGMRKVLTDHSDLVLSADLGSDQVLDIDDFDSLSAGASAFYRHRTHPDNVVTAGARISQLWFDGDALRSQFRLSVSNDKGFGEGKNLLTGLSISSINYDSDELVGVRDRDADNVALSVSYTTAMSVGWEFTVGGSYARNNAVGGDYDFDSLGVFVSAEYDLPYQLALASAPVSIKFQAAITESDYDNPSSFGGVAGQAREDSRNQLSINTTIPIRRGLSAFVRLSHLDNGSNVGVFDYDQTRIMTGLSYAWRGQ